MSMKTGWPHLEYGTVVGVARRADAAETLLNVERRGASPVVLRVYDLSTATRPGDVIRWTEKFALVTRPGEEHTLRILPAHPRHPSGKPIGGTGENETENHDV